MFLGMNMCVGYMSSSVNHKSNNLFLNFCRQARFGKAKLGLHVPPFPSFSQVNLTSHHHRFQVVLWVFPSAPKVRLPELTRKSLLHLQRIGYNPKGTGHIVFSLVYLVVNLAALVGLRQVKVVRYSAEKKLFRLEMKRLSTSSIINVE